MTTGHPETALPPMVAAQHRAMPFTRLTDYGMDPADVLQEMEEDDQPRLHSVWLARPFSQSTRWRGLFSQSVASGMSTSPVSSAITPQTRAI